ncbi:tRNA pseudouridine(38-40) synthase TruA [Candidatus Cardinium hertigii]|jgi:tRNA pseudouridine38-40 synthase|uniref:tRNA pseudouridine synthase A n=1 Tax=Candidatus Cardinium hertigii TaxID=247481 RepID=A0A3N2QBP6_9BACT|nr:tRNA pseudouridine(38-40) synthase TruA [Candidatus Cardinium hertigii]ROT47069.1 tRNA pseudouridine(38-40) synthase TruA [Candidatus Cardinium hertigii]
MRYFIYLSYFGKAYSGWQIQQNALSVQQVVQEVLSSLLSTEVFILGSSRTDKGVHAKQQVAHFDVMQPIDLANLKYRLNRVLPADMGITAICPVVDGAHARFDASYRIYEYTIISHKDPFDRHTAFWLGHLPPLELLNQAAALFRIQADFEFFSKSSNQAKTFVCTIQESYWLQLGDKIVFRIQADRFLRGMVRAIVSAILKVGSGKMCLDTLKKLIVKKPTERPGLTLVPPHGLTLVAVGYPEALFLKKNES